MVVNVTPASAMEIRYETNPFIMTPNITIPTIQVIIGAIMNGLVSYHISMAESGVTFTIMLGVFYL